jgi:Ca-activated chloride channel family protein
VNALRLAHPEWWSALALVSLGLALALLAAGWRARWRRRRLGARGRLLVPGLRSDAALLLAFVALALALLGPRIGERVRLVPASGVDLVIALDVSRSMDARDVPPSRLDRARRAARGVLERLGPFDRVGLAAFGGVGVLLAPLTPDRAVIGELLDGVETGLIAPASSDLAAGVAAALTAFEPGSTRPRSLLLLTDGEDPEQRRELGAGAAARADVRVLVAAFGGEAGATLPDHGVPLVDRSGRTVVSRRDLARLEPLARATDGELFPADAWGEVDLAGVVRSLRRDAGAAPGDVVRRRVPAVRVLPFALLAFALLGLEGLPRPARRRAGRRTSRWLPATASALAAIGLLPGSAGGSGATLDGLEARVRAQPGDAASLVALGAARLERGRRRAAARAFLAAAVRARSAREAAIAYYDLGVAELESGDLEAARDAFLDALALAPDDERARFNLEWTALALRRSQPAPAPQPAALASPPDAEPPAEPEPAPQPEREETQERTASEPPPLDEAAQRRWLEQVEDDPGRALRSAASGQGAPSRSAGPVW